MSQLNPASTVIFNVGGAKFEITASLVSKYPNSTLYQLYASQLSKSPTLSQSSSPSSSSSSSFPSYSKQQPKEIFLDHNPQAFSVILDFLRYDKLYVPPSVCKEVVVLQMQTLGLPTVEFIQSTTTTSSTSSSTISGLSSTDIKGDPKENSFRDHSIKNSDLMDQNHTPLPAYDAPYYSIPSYTSNAYHSSFHTSTAGTLYPNIPVVYSTTSLSLPSSSLSTSSISTSSTSSHFVMVQNATVTQLDTLLNYYLLPALSSHASRGHHQVDFIIAPSSLNKELALSTFEVSSTPREWISLPETLNININSNINSNSSYSSEKSYIGNSGKDTTFDFKFLLQSGILKQLEEFMMMRGCVRKVSAMERSIPIRTENAFGLISTELIPVVEMQTILV